MPEALPAVTVPFLSKAGRSFDNTSTVVPCFGCSSVSTTVSPRRVAILTGTISSLNRPSFCAASALDLRGRRKVVLLIAGDLPALRNILGGVAHVVAVERIPQPVADHRVDEFGIAHLDAVAQMDAVRRLAHALLPAGDDDLGIAVADRLITERHGAQPRAAKLIDAIGGDFEGHPRRDRRLPSRVLPLAGGEDLAHDDLRHLLRLDMRAAQRLDDRDLAELMGRQAG